MSEIWDKGLGHVNTPASPFLVILLKERKVYFVFTQLRRKKAWNSNRKSNQLFVFHSDITLRPSCNMDRLASVAVSPVFALSYFHTSASVFQSLDLELLFFFFFFILSSDGSAHHYSLRYWYDQYADRTQFVPQPTLFTEPYYHS